jgi:serine phosphatase RsbU (regulator of sigma subunit)
LQSARDRNFTNNAIQLQKGDIVYIFTDGYADQFGGENGKKLMSTRFKELLLSIRQMEMKAQEKYLLHYFEQWKGDMEQVDDVLVIGIRV